MEENLYKSTRTLKSLRAAWKVVRSSGLKSQSKEIRDSVLEFEQQLERNLDSIYRRLLRKKYRFPPSIGVPKRKKSGGIRPIVISPIEAKIVQRSILDTLTNIDELKPYFEVETSFGGLKGKNVPQALKAVASAISSGATYYARSDVISFFTQVPKPYVVELLGRITSDIDFINLVDSAIQTELSNLAELGANAKAFPLYEIGVAQGSCLSPLISNIVLNDFDRIVNSDDITCIRFIDDFVVLGPNHKAVNAAMRRGQKALEVHGLEIYKPEDAGDKASHGETSKMFEFLGCDLKPGLVRPGRKSQKNLLSKVDSLIQNSLKLMHNPNEVASKKVSLVDTLKSISNLVDGWGNQYSFCNDPELMGRLDENVDTLIESYLQNYQRVRKRFSSEACTNDRRRILGVKLLEDCNRKPSIW